MMSHYQFNYVAELLN